MVDEKPSNADLVVQVVREAPEPLLFAEIVVCYYSMRSSAASNSAEFPCPRKLANQGVHYGFTQLLTGPFANGSVYFRKMIIATYQGAIEFNRNRRNPDIVFRDWPAFLSQ
jgi:hypothetical protein